jgi:very-short-patch-repair endonuclease
LSEGAHRPRSLSPTSGGSVSRSEAQGEVSDDRLPTREFAKSLRGKLTRAETILWSRLRRDQVAGYRFRKQHPIGPYVADFACLLAKLIVEVDGGTHSTDRERAYDRARDAYLRERGWRVCRVWNEDVYKNSDGVLETIYALLRESEPKGKLR